MWCVPPFPPFFFLLSMYRRTNQFFFNWLNKHQRSQPTSHATIIASHLLFRELGGRRVNLLAVTVPLKDWSGIWLGLAWQHGFVRHCHCNLLGWVQHDWGDCMVKRTLFWLVTAIYLRPWHSGGFIRHCSRRKFLIFFSYSSDNCPIGMECENNRFKCVCVCVYVNVDGKQDF